MSDRINGYADAMLAVAQAEGDVKGISDELFAVGRAVDTNDDLLTAISDSRMPAERKIQIMDDLLDGKARAATKCCDWVEVGGDVRPRSIHTGMVHSHSIT